MRDNYDEKLETLFAATRSEQVDTSALEAHFETRLMARITERKVQSVPWHLMVWRLIPGFAAIAVISIACSISFNPVRSSDIFAPITVGQEETLFSNVISGE